MRALTDADLRRIYRAIGTAQASGGFGGRHGPLEATAWLHIAVADLERLDDAVSSVTMGDHGALDVLRSLGTYEDRFVPIGVSDSLDQDELRRAPLGVRDPVALAVAAHILATRGDPAAAERLMWFAVRRTAAVNLALDVADRYAAGWFSARYFDSRMRAISPLAIDGGAGHGGESNRHGHDDTHSRDGLGHDDGNDLEPGHDGETVDRHESEHAHHAGCRCLDHERLTSALYRRWRDILHAAGEEAGVTTFPASDESSLYERVLDRVDAPAGRRPHAPSAASPVTLTAPTPAPADDVAAPPPRLTLTACAPSVAIGEPMHLWVRLEGIDVATAVVIEGAKAEPVEVTVKPKEWETLATVKPAREVGVVNLTATVAGLGLATAPTPIEVVRERPPCPPNEGGAWQLAHVEAHERVEKCRPAEALEETGARLVGEAGKSLTGAYNSAVVGTQLCGKAANTERCARYRKENVKTCVEERDEGYENCTEKRDQGYKRCCDWWPCSWLCKAWVWVSNIVCVAWEWIKNIVCVAWEWIKNVVCAVWEVIKAAACMVVAIATGIVKAVIGVAELFVGLGISAAGKVVELACRMAGSRGREQVSETLKVVAVHMALLRTGKVLLMGYDEGVYPVDADHPADFTAVADSDRGLCAIWDPTTGKARYTTDLQRNLFCSHHSFLPDGRLLVAGGQFPLPGLPKSLLPWRLLAPGADADLHLFDPVSETWHRLRNMQKGRWYPTCVTLPDGRVFITSGTNGYAASEGLGRGIQDTWEYADGTGPLGGKQDAGFYWFHLYPFQHVLANGRVFTHADRATRLFDPTNDQNPWSRVAPNDPLHYGPGTTVWPYSRTGPGPGTSVLLPLQPIWQAGRWLYPTGQVMILGGGGAEGEPEPIIRGERYDLHADTPATRTAEILDLGELPPAWRETTSMSNGRVMPDSVLLPDGTVLVVGGGRFGKSGGLLAHFASVERGGEPDKGALDPVLEPELYDPVTEAWRVLCRKPIGRLYHTTAMLLPDGRVLVAGHDGALNMEPYDRSRYELELFSPPYLFAPDGSPANRPRLARAPEIVNYGQAFEATVSEHIRSAALIRPSALTHQINPEQRYVGLGINAQHAGGELVVAAPPDANVAPPGWYLLFVVSDSGTPSVGSWVQVKPG